MGSLKSPTAWLSIETFSSCLVFEKRFLCNVSMGRGLSLRVILMGPNSKESVLCKACVGLAIGRHSSRLL